jgi:hypothetical protein
MAQPRLPANDCTRDEWDVSCVTDPVVIACVEQAAKHARLPPIDRPTFTVAFPYRLGESSAQTSGR